MARSRYGTCGNSASVCVCVSVCYICTLEFTNACVRGEVAALFEHHSAAVTSVEWAWHDSTVFASSGADNQVCCV